MNIYLEDGKMNSTFICEDYLIAKIVLSNNSEDCRHIAFEYMDTDMLEFGLDRKTGLLKKIVLVLCNHYEIKNTSLEAPIASSCKLFIEAPRVYSCNFFNTVIYRDGLWIQLSNTKSDKFVSCGNVVVGLDGTNLISEMYVKNLSHDEIEHVIYEINRI